jgi:NRPS condensation-like uncharacterized protein
MKTAKKHGNNNRERFRAEMWDQMQFFYKEYNDHQLHAVIYFKDLLDRQCIQRAVLFSMDMVPLLGSRFVVNKFRPYWEKVSQYPDADIISFIDCVNPEEEISRFITGTTNELTGPQIMVRVIRSSNKDTLCIVMNHMICDAAGFKEYLYLLSTIYTRLRSGAGGMSEYHEGSRSAKQIYRRFNLWDRLKIALLPNEPLKNKNNVCFPLSKESSLIPFILTHKISQDRFHVLKAYGKAHSATMNDMVLAAYYRALYEILDINQDESLTVPCMVDLRRYLPDKEADAICNLSSMIMCNIGPEIGVNFEETLGKVNREMSAQKKGYPGLHGLSTLNAVFRFLPFSTVKQLIKRKYVNPLIAISNLGIIDSKRLIFGKTPIEEAFATGSIKYPPYSQLALSSFNNTITFSVSLYGSEKDRESVRTFLDILDKELQSIS